MSTVKVGQTDVTFARAKTNKIYFFTASARKKRFSSRELNTLENNFRGDAFSKKEVMVEFNGLNYVIYKKFNVFNPMDTKFVNLLYRFEFFNNDKEKNIYLRSLQQKERNEGLMQTILDYLEISVDMLPGLNGHKKN